MTQTLKVLGQSALAATTLTDVYTVPSSTSTTVSSVVICNAAGTATTFRLSIAVAGAADTAKQYLYYDTSLAANDTFIATIGVTLAATDILRAYAGNANLSVTVYGVEIS